VMTNAKDGWRHGAIAAGQESSPKIALFLWQ